MRRFLSWNPVSVRPFRSCLSRTRRHSECDINFNERRHVRSLRVGACVIGFGMVACGDGSRSASGSGDASFTSLASEVIQDFYKRHPSAATLLGVHTYDNQLEDFSASAFDAEAKADSAFRAR